MSAVPLAIRHICLPGIVDFSYAQKLQQTLVQQFLAHKAVVSSPRSKSDILLPPPTPTIITFSPSPVYTLGRREHGSLSDEQKDLLRRPFTPRRPTRFNPRQQPEAAELYETQRGGQITFHGPGQIVIYPILDLKPATAYSGFPQGLTVRSYVELLEQTTIDTLSQWNIKGIRTEHPGVWVRTKAEEDEKKIAALGVHLRRNVTSYGVGLNVTTDLGWFDRIVACGIKDKKVTTMYQSEMDQRDGGKNGEITELAGFPKSKVDRDSAIMADRGTVARRWVEIFAAHLAKESGAETEVCGQSNLQIIVDDVDRR